MSKVKIINSPKARNADKQFPKAMAFHRYTSARSSERFLTAAGSTAVGGALVGATIAGGPGALVGGIAGVIVASMANPRFRK